jgi:EamA domain-containing membrane protein RarD
MNGFLFSGMGVVTIALSFYTIFFILKTKSKNLTVKICIILSIGAIFDISGTILMIIGSKKIPLTVHGIIGYTALTAMMIEAILMWRHLAKHQNKETTKFLNIYTISAYSWWVLAYFAGGALVLLEL